MSSTGRPSMSNDTAFLRSSQSRMMYARMMGMAAMCARCLCAMQAFAARAAHMLAAEVVERQRRQAG